MAIIATNMERNTVSIFNPHVGLSESLTCFLEIFHRASVSSPTPPSSLPQPTLNSLQQIQQQGISISHHLNSTHLVLVDSPSLPSRRDPLQHPPPLHLLFSSSVCSSSNALTLCLTTTGQNTPHFPAALMKCSPPCSVFPFPDQPEQFNRVGYPHSHTGKCGRILSGSVKAMKLLQWPQMV
ncbi:hypothetical protein EX30DRAFT_136326 [Ascodesmis nigricans]|uniref:Uncharacterized protein n=1 Tax=Ascodesmis nigricans TaxID=341454 RepID=A0A4S2MSC6_9PEZI|nr:hypothetical protein EX30DRAFT_136326 [Ascodesmis nigricans]